MGCSEQINLPKSECGEIYNRDNSRVRQSAIIGVSIGAGLVRKISAMSGLYCAPTRNSDNNLSNFLGKLSLASSVSIADLKRQTDRLINERSAIETMSELGISAARAGKAMRECFIELKKLEAESRNNEWKKDKRLPGNQTHEKSYTYHR